MTGRQFVAVVPHQVAALGIPAATVLAHLTYLTRRRPGGVVATAQDFADGTGLTLRTVQRAVARLVDQGVIIGERAAPWNPTRRWQIVADHPVCAGQHVTATSATTLTATSATTSVPLEGEEVDTAPLAPTEQGMLPFVALLPDPPEDPPAEAVEQAGPPKTAQTLVARWVDGYRTVNAGADPHKAVLPRVAGQARNLAKACGEDHDAWVDAYHATYNAGVAGSHDLVRYLVPQQQRRQSTARRNVWAEPSMGGPDAGSMDRFSAMMTGDQPRALGSAQ